MLTLVLPHCLNNLEKSLNFLIVVRSLLFWIFLANIVKTMSLVLLAANTCGAVFLALPSVGIHL